MEVQYYCSALLCCTYQVVNNDTIVLPDSAPSWSRDTLTVFCFADTPVTSSSSSSAGPNSRTGTTADPVSDLMAGEGDSGPIFIIGGYNLHVSRVRSGRVQLCGREPRVPDCQRARVRSQPPPPRQGGGVHTGGGIGHQASILASDWSMRS